MTWPNDCQKKLEVGRKERNPFLECGGKRSATPLWIRRTRKAGTLRQYWRAPEIQSAVAAALCRRTPKPQCGGAKHIRTACPHSAVWTLGIWVGLVFLPFASFVGNFVGKNAGTLSLRVRARFHAVF